VRLDHSENVFRFPPKDLDLQSVDGPPVPQSDTARRQPRKIRFSAQEWAVIVDHARLCGRAPARYVRETALGAVPRSTRAQAAAPIIHELGRLGTQLRRLTEQLSATPDSPQAKQLDQLLTEILSTVQQLE
jgi:hypothetical protein